MASEAPASFPPKKTKDRHSSPCCASARPPDVRRTVEGKRTLLLIAAKAAKLCKSEDTARMKLGV